jgi:hypothetical protein
VKGSDLLKEWGKIVKGVNTTPDVDTDEIKTQAAKFGNTVDKDGKPPTLSKKVNGKSTNVLFNLGLAEGIILKFERDKHLDVLHIMDTKEKHRVEVRGKPGYERGNHDSNDKLHQVLDALGKAANFAELMNGETVSVNPNHPHGTRAIRTAKDILQTENRFTDMELALMEGGHSIDDYIPEEKTPGDLFNALEEKWSQKYKRSINCNNPKGFSQKAHCAGRKKNEATSPQMDPKAIEFEMLRDAEKRRLAGEYKRIGAELAITTWGAALAQAVANYLGGQYLSQLELMLVQKGIEKVATENFADGKKKGKSRPGRVKRAGASCNGSVTSLRKRAKNSSGEKAKMYHWCANMKSGRKKK